jgi:hypothetical protein
VAPLAPPLVRARALRVTLAMTDCLHDLPQDEALRLAGVHLTTDDLAAMTLANTDDDLAPLNAKSLRPLNVCSRSCPAATGGSWSVCATSLLLGSRALRSVSTPRGGRIRSADALNSEPERRRPSYVMGRRACLSIASTQPRAALSRSDRHALKHWM